MRRCLLLSALLALAACGGKTHAATTVRPAAAPAPRFRATLTAPTHRPRAGAPWLYSVRVTDVHGKPIRARIRMQVLFAGVPAGQVDKGRTFSFVGTWREPKSSPVIWPARSRGQPLVFQALVTAQGQTKALNYPIRVR